MASIIGRAAFRATRPLRAAGPTAGANASNAETSEARQALSKGARRDPELYTLGFIMTCAFAGAGYYFSSKPTSAISEQKVPQVPGSEPWNTGGEGKYQYHPQGDTSQARKEAPSALNTVIVPNVNLPKELHEKFNKWGKDDY